jgi:hypothetical protein
MMKLMRKTLAISLLVLVMTALVISMATPAWAAPSPAAQAQRTVQGKVNSISGSSLVIQNGNQSPVTINVDGTTKYYRIAMGKAQAYVNNTAGKDNKEAKAAGKPQPPRAADLKNAHVPANWKDNLGWLETFDTATKFSEIQVGDRIIARVTGDAANLAKQVLLIKAPVIQTVKGTISAVSGSSVTVNGVPLNVDGNTRISLKGLLSVQVNQFAVAVYNRVTSVAQTISIQPISIQQPPSATTNSLLQPTLTLNTITVTAAVSGNLTPGNTRQFGAIGSYSNGSTADISTQVIWSSSIPAFASISSTGLAQGVTAGTTSITAAKGSIISPPVSLVVSTQP